MAASILTPEKKYQLPEADRKKIRQLADNPNAEMPLRAILKIERQRLAFINRYGPENDPLGEIK